MTASRGWYPSNVFLPRPPFTEVETEDIAERVYNYVWHRSASGNDLAVA